MAKVSTSTETITPQMAESWLEKNKDNRPIRDHHVQMLAKEMKEARWQLNGEAIVFDSNGGLLDGQHRLWAAYSFAQSFQSVVVRGVHPDAFHTIDSGMKRSAGDVLTKSGLQYGTLTAAAIRLVSFYENGARDHKLIQRTSNAETMELVAKYPRIKEAVGLVGPMDGVKRVASQSAMAAFVYYAMDADLEQTNALLAAIDSGADLRKGDPRLTCRNYLVNSKAQSVRLQNRVQFALLIKTWNAVIEKRDVKVLRFIEGEEFPQFAHCVRRRRS